VPVARRLGRESLSRHARHLERQKHRCKAFRRQNAKRSRPVHDSIGVGGTGVLACGLRACRQRRAACAALTAPDSGVSGAHTRAHAHAHAHAHMRAHRSKKGVPVRCATACVASGSTRTRTRAHTAPFPACVTPHRSTATSARPQGGASRQTRTIAAKQQSSKACHIGAHMHTHAHATAAPQSWCA
jgi:hypothetical protein